MRRLWVVWVVLLLLVPAGAQAQGLGSGPGIWSFGLAGLNCTSGGCTFANPSLLANGTAAAPALTFTSDPDTGFYLTGDNSGVVGFSSAGANYQRFSANGIGIRSDGFVGWASDVNFSSTDTKLVRDGAANTLAQKNGNADQFARLYGANGGYWESGANSELLTLAVAASTDTAGNLLPADAIIEAVTVRVVTIIPTAATFTVGDATTAGRFATGVAVAANTTAVGILQWNPANAAAAGPIQSAAAKVRITPNLSPAAATGQVRITVFYRRFVAPTS